MIFPEGFFTVGGLAKFKKGAFNSLCAVTPIILRQINSCVYLGAYASNDHCPIIANMCTLAFSKMRVTTFPPFVPNEYLFNTRPDVPKWEVYADAVREMMLEKSGLKPSDATYSQVKEYVNLMQGKGTAPWSRDFKK